jgi:predicted nucleotidyltransferase
MDHRISATELARGLGDILGRIRYRGETFTVERNGKPVARIGPVTSMGAATVRAAITAWLGKRAAATDMPDTVAQVMRRRGVVRAGVFGSVARGEASAVSDVDFLVELERGRSLLDLAGLQLDLEEVLGCDVDVATPNSLHPALKDEIMRDLVPVL